MKTFFVCWAIGVALPVLALAQSAFQKGVVVLQPGIGYGLIGTVGEVEIPPFSLNLEVAGNSEWSIGGYVGYASAKETYLSSGNTGGWWTLPDWGFKATYLIFGGRLNYHMNTESEKVDTYAGVMLGYNAVSLSVWGGGDPSRQLLGASGVLYGGQAGIRYYLSPALGVFAEAGYGVSYVTAGLSLKLGGHGRDEMAEAAEARNAEQSIWRKWDERVSSAEMEELDEASSINRDIERRRERRVNHAATEELDESSNASQDIWNKWNQRVNRVEMGEAEAEEEIVVRVKILYMKNGLCIINFGKNKGLNTGMDVIVYPRFDHTSSEKQGFPARITETRMRHAVIKILNASLAAMLATGDELVLKVSPARVDNY